MLLKALSGFMIYVLAVTQVVAQTAALVPNAKQTFLGTTGAPLAAGTVTMYVPNSTTKKTTWVDPNQTSANVNPIQLDAAGRAIIFGQGNYRQIVKDKNGVTIWDSFTSASGSAAPSGATGTDTAPVGAVMPFSGFVMPTNWQLAYGQGLVRATFPDLLAAITISNVSVTCTATSVTLTGFVATAQMRVGAPIEATCLPSNTTIATIPGPTSVTVNNAAVSSGTVTAVVFPWGNGDGVSTFNVPDLRGRIAPGADAMGGTAASRLTTTYYGVVASAPGVGGGTESKTFLQANLPVLTWPNTLGISLGNAGTVVSAPAITGLDATGGASSAGFNTGAASIVAITGSVTGSVTSGGSGTPISVVQPSLTMNYIIKVAPNTSGAGGVVSIGGMFGDIVCDSTLSCPPLGTTNTIGCTSATPSQYGCVRPDGTTIVVGITGNLSAVGAAATEITNGVTTIGSGTTGRILYDNAGVLGELSVGTGLSLSGSSLITAAGVPTNTLNTVTSVYTIQTTDCGKTVQAGTGSTGQFTIALPAVTGFSATCSVTVLNGDTGRGKKLSAFPVPIRTMLYPKQSLTVQIVNGAWATTVDPGRWQLQSSTTFYASILGDDTNDGLSSSTPRTPQGMVTGISKDVDAKYNQIIVQGTVGETWTSGIVLPDVVGADNGNWPSPGLAIQGDAATPANLAFTSGGNCFTAVNVHTSWMIRGFTFTCAGASILADYGSSIYVGNNIFSSGNIHAQSINAGSRIEFTTGYKIQGSANVHWYAAQGGQIITQPAAIDVNTGPSFSGAFAFASQNGIMFVNGMTFTGGPSVIGKVFIIDTAGGINTGSGGAPGYLPGNVAGTTTAPGWYQ